MADRKLDIIVRMRDQASKGLKGVNKDVKSLGTQAKVATKSMMGLYTGLAAFAGVLAGGALFGKVIKDFAAFDDNMRAAGAVTKATTEELNLMTEAAKRMGRDTRYTASQAAEALKFLGMAGLDAAEATKALPGVLNLAAAGALDLGVAADIATNVLSAFGLEIKDLDRVNDVLVTAFTSANVNLVELGEAFKMVGPISKAVGGDFEDLITAIAMLGSTAIKGTMGGTSLKNAIEALMAPTAQEAELMKDLAQRMGVVALQVKDTEGNFIGFVEIIKQLEKAGMDGTDALKLFGRAGPAMAGLMNQGSAAMEKLRDSIRDVGGASRRIAEQMEAGIGGQIRKTISILESFRLELGEAFGPEVEIILAEFRNWVRRLIDTVIELKEDGSLKGWGQTVVDVFKVLGWLFDKTITSLRLITSFSIAAGAALSGNFRIAREALKDYNNEAKKMFGIDQQKQIEQTGTVIKKVTQEMYDDLKKMQDASSQPIGKGYQKDAYGTVKVIRASRTEINGFLKDALRAYEGARKAVAEYARKVLEWEQKIKDIRMTTADRIRELGRKVMGDEAAWKDRQLQAEEKLQAAKKALREKDYKNAEALAKQSADLYASLGEDLKTEGDPDDPWGMNKSFEETVRIAQDGVAEIGKFIETVYTEQQKNDTAALKSFEKLSEKIRKTLDEIVIKRDANIAIKLIDLMKTQSELKDLAKPLTKWITVKYKTEGKPQEKQDGGTIGGYGGGDTVPALLEKGEGILTKEAVRQYPGLVDVANSLKLNASSLLSKFKFGGIVGSAPDLSGILKMQDGGVVGANNTTGNSETLVVKFQAGNKEADVLINDRVSREAMKGIANELSRMRLVYAK